MAHTVRKVNLGNSAHAEVNITSYTAGQGGEQFTAAEFGITGTVTSVRFIQTVNATDGLANSNSNFAVYKGAGRVMLMDIANPSNELATTSGMNYLLDVIITGS